jgi:hypothetical protein
MTAFDKLAENDGDEEWLAWLKTVFAAKDEIVAFVSNRRNGCQDGNTSDSIKALSILALLSSLAMEEPLFASPNPDTQRQS